MTSDHGVVMFTVPGMAEFIARQPEWSFWRPTAGNERDSREVPGRG